MSELKVHRFITTDELFSEANAGALYYNKSEADKVIDALKHDVENWIGSYEASRRVNARTESKLCHSNYKRCLTMARMCEERSARYDVLQERHDLDWGREIEFYHRWYKRWLELAEKFKPNSTAQ